MAIKVECSCGKRFQVMDELAGRKARCPSCQELVRVPGEKAQERDAGYALEDIRKCPECKREWPGEAVICVQCGYNFKTGKAVERTYDILNQSIHFGVRWLGTYTHFQFFRGRRGQASLTIKKRFLFLPVGSRVIDLNDYDAVLIDCGIGDPGESVADVYYLELEGPRKRPIRILRTTNEWKMREVVDTLKEVAGLTIKRK
jgi:hypothetical protein